jgi:glycosyltransferase involved in cell wall biosynthesis
MTLTFFTNFINHHQVPLADEFYKRLGVNYNFIATMPIPDSFIEAGYPDYSDKPYLLKAFANHEAYDKALKMATDSDVVIMGAAPEIFIKTRLKENKLTFRYNERWFKKITYRLLSPGLWIRLYNNHTKYRNKNFYLLAAGAYVICDANKFFAYPNKCYKWGYFTKIEDINIKEKLKKKEEHKALILWCARFLVWKHPELPVKLAKILTDKGYDFQLSMIGSGELLQATKQLASKLNVSDKINFCGNIPNNEVLQMMREHDIFLFTSNGEEGWGAVLNEAMSNGCTVVASDRIGATPFLVEDGINGYIFKSEKLNSLAQKVEKLINDKDLRESFAIKAYDTMRTIWSPEKAAENFINVSTSLLNGFPREIDMGPCSRAYKFLKRSKQLNT